MPRQACLGSIESRWEEEPQSGREKNPGQWKKSFRRESAKSRRFLLPQHNDNPQVPQLFSRTIIVPNTIHCSFKSFLLIVSAAQFSPFRAPKRGQLGDHPSDRGWQSRPRIAIAPSSRTLPTRGDYNRTYLAEQAAFAVGSARDWVANDSGGFGRSRWLHTDGFRRLNRGKRRFVRIRGHNVVVERMRGGETNGLHHSSAPSLPSRREAVGPRPGASSQALTKTRAAPAEEVSSTLSEPTVRESRYFYQWVRLTSSNRKPLPPTRGRELALKEPVTSPKTKERCKIFHPVSGRAKRKRKKRKNTGKMYRRKLETKLEVSLTVAGESLKAGWSFALQKV